MVNRLQTRWAKIGAVALMVTAVVALIYWLRTSVAPRTGNADEGEFLLLDQEDRHVRGFIPKASPGDLPPDAELGGMIREWITAGTSR